MQFVRKALVAAASVAGLMAVLGTAPASAAPVPFTWDPSASGLVGGLALSTQGAFSADRGTLGDWATITIDPTNLNDVVEQAVLPIQMFTLGGNPVTLSGTPFQLYFQVTAHSTLSGVPTPSNTVTGAFTSINYTLFGVRGTCTYGATTGGAGAACSGTTYDLASGVLAAPPGPENNVAVNQGTPGSNALVTASPDADAGGFFVSPNLLVSLFEAAFTNTGGVAQFFTVGTNTVIVINGGGGNTDMLAAPVPEPLTLSVFGAGLVGAAAIGRRRRSKKA